jgi:hypothetical protein
MQFDQEQLNQIELFASRAFSPRDIAVILSVPVQDFEFRFTNNEDPAFLAFEKGRLRAELDLRNNIYASAISGSSPAQAEMEKLFKTQRNHIKTLNHA